MMINNLLSFQFSLTILLFLCYRPVLGSIIRCLQTERQALLEFKRELVDDYGRLSSWGIAKNERECCEWRGVYCHNRTNRVMRLDLSGPSVLDDEFKHIPSAPLQGKISPSLLGLPHLTYLDLSFNYFGYSSFPEFVGSMSNLQYLNLSCTYFSGPIPPHLGNLSELLYLDLSQGGGLSSENLDWVSNLYALEYLDLSEVTLSEATNWLEAISKLSSLKELHLSSCQPSKIVPSSLSLINGSTSLEILDLSSNFLTTDSLFSSTVGFFLNFSTSITYIDLSSISLMGTINPDYFKNMVSLAYLDLSRNNLEGGIPKSFGNLSSLRHLDLSGNSLTGQLYDLMMNMSGPIETRLEYLDLKENMISGALPNMSKLAFLRELKLAENQLNGSIPEGNLQLRSLVLLDLSSNKIAGPVPDLSFSSSLKELYLQKNMFNGSITELIRHLSTELEVLFLSSNHLEGTITEASLQHFSSLLVIDLSFNSFLTIKCSPQWIPPFQLKYMDLAHCKVGPEFPNWLRTQKELSYLDISDAKISDSVPSWFVNVTSKLVSLNASNNQIFGVLPNFSFPAINFVGSSGTIFPVPGIVLDISNNKFSGSVTFLCHTIGWRLLDLSHNLFSNQIPDCFGKFENLTYLNLANNQFIGEIPSSFGFLNSLSFLYLRNNSLFGGIPISMRNCTSLEIIDVGENRLSGEIPAWIGNNSEIEVLSLRSNEFYGTIPSSLCLLENLKVLDLSSNLISGGIPKCIQNLTALITDVMTVSLSSFGYAGWDSQHYGGVTSFSSRIPFDNAYIMWKRKELNFINSVGLLTFIDLSSNTLVGEIPSEITELVNLIALNLSRNNLTGPIPQKIGQLDSLQFLDFSRNRFSGGIPNSLTQLNLGVLDLSYNNLSGRIPQNTQLGTYNDAFIGNPGLCGRPLVKSCPGDEAGQDDHPKLSGNNNAMDEEDDALITGGFYIATGIGFFLGFWGVFGRKLINRSWRHRFYKI